MTTDTRLESSLELFFRKRIRLLGGMAIKLVPTEAGLPDRLVIMPGGRVYLVELKTEYGTVSPIQQVYHRRLNQVGMPVYVLYGQEDILDWLRDMFDQEYEQDRRTLNLDWG